MIALLVRHAQGLQCACNCGMDLAVDQAKLSEERRRRICNDQQFFRRGIWLAGQKVFSEKSNGNWALRGPLRKQSLVELGAHLKERFSCFAASQPAQRNSPRLLAEILTFGRAPRGGTRRKLFSLPVGFLADNFLACQPNSSPKELLIIADPPPAFLTELCLIDSQVHPAVASTLEPLCMPYQQRNQELSSRENGPWELNGRQSKAMTYTSKSCFDPTTNLAKQPSSAKVFSGCLKRGAQNRYRGNGT